MKKDFNTTKCPICNKYLAHCGYQSWSCTCVDLYIHLTPYSKIDYFYIGASNITYTYFATLGKYVTEEPNLLNAEFDEIINDLKVNVKEVRTICLLKE